MCLFFVYFFGNAFALLHILILYVLCTARKLKIWDIKINYIFILKYIFLRLKLLLSWWHFKWVFLEKKSFYKEYTAADIRSLQPQISRDGRRITALASF